MTATIADVELEQPTGDRPCCEARCSCPDHEHGCHDPAECRVSWTCIEHGHPHRVVALLCPEHAEQLDERVPDAVVRWL